MDSIHENENISIDLEKNEVQMKQWQTEIETTEELLKISRSLQNQKQALQISQKQLVQAETIYQDKKDAYDKAAHAFRFNQAGLLARTLETGQPCPVCGSIHHPHKASMVDAQYTEEVVNRLNKEQEQEKNSVDRCAYIAYQQKITYEEAKKRWIKDVQRLLAPVQQIRTRDEWTAALQHHRNESKKQWALTKQQDAQWKQRQKQCENEKKQLEALRETLRLAHTQTEKLFYQQQQLYNQKHQLEGMLQALPPLEYASLQQARIQRNRLEQEVEQWQAGLRSKQDSLDTSRQHLTALRSKQQTLAYQNEQTQKELDRLYQEWDAQIQDNGFTSRDECISFLVDEAALKANKNTIDAYEKTVSDIGSQLKYASQQADALEYQDIQVITDALHKKERALIDIRHRYDIDKERFHNNQKWIRAFMAQANEIDAIRKRRDQTRHLYALLRGTISGKNRISLENYVQITGFKNIIEAANRRLEPMTEGQYQLYLHEDDDSIRQNIFELDILDRWTGKKRSVKTLSGGESFKTSLSLALGLSDFVTSASGGIQIHTLFIDEGFGTLDQQSLQDAMFVLNQLSEKGKMVGIISHREELKEQIARQIVVTKQRSGSHIHMKWDI